MVWFNEDISLSGLSFSCFWIMFHYSAAFAVIEDFPYIFVLLEGFMRLPYLDFEVTKLCLSEEKLNLVLKTDDEKLIKDFPIG